MRATLLIEKLQELVLKHGDLECDTQDDVQQLIDTVEYNEDTNKFYIN